jgi:cysteinyl-tRNA synthetase
MSEALLGLPLDIHGGGQDLIFPHHEDEIAQSEAAFETKLSNFWVHNGMVNVDKVKMSKSLGNYKTIRDLLKDFPGEVIRYFVISAHYRGPIDFSQSSLVDAKNSYTRLKKLVLEIADDGEENIEYLQKFTNAMDDDLSTPRALAILWEIVRDPKAKGKYQTIKKIDSIFGLNLFVKEELEIPQEVLQLFNEREEARKAKNWTKADELRTKINALGYAILDSQKESKIEKLAS